ncbi:MAG TPA: hypothetical protein VK943_20120 [Arenibaculum sp.]|nr:hypothetical protein [Arenibaculum sp.]
MGNGILRAFVIPGALAVSACAPADLPPQSPAASSGDVTVVEPTRRDPLGYPGRPVDGSPYSSELDGQGLPRPLDLTRRDTAD